MKKQSIAILALLCAVKLANAQTEKGNQTVGLNLGYTYVKSTEVPIVPMPSQTSYIQSYKNTNFNIGPSYSYFIANNLDLGVSLNYTNSKQDALQSSLISTLSNTSYGGNIYLRKYVLYNNKIGFRTGGMVGYSRNISKENYAVTSSNIEYKGNTFYGGLMLDLVYYPTKKLGLAANIINANFSHERIDNGLLTRGTTNSFNFNFINNGLQLSAFYTFGGK